MRVAITHLSKGQENGNHQSTYTESGCIAREGGCHLLGKKKEDVIYLKGRRMAISQQKKVNEDSNL